MPSETRIYSMKKKIFKRILIALMGVTLAGILAVTGINFFVTLTTSDDIVTSSRASDYGADCILVLGCQVRADGSPSLMLADRLDMGVELYKSGAAPKILMSGDHSGDYNEVHTMKQYAVSRDIPSEDVFMDHAGYSTYESLYRAKHIYGVKKVVIVTQKYHLYRALYIARSLGLDAVGVPAAEIKYAGQLGRDVRELLARVKDFGQTVIRPEFSLNETAYPIGGSGNLTNNGEEFQ